MPYMCMYKDLKKMRSVSLLNDLEHTMYNCCIAACVHIYNVHVQVHVHV